MERSPTHHPARPAGLARVAQALAVDAATREVVSGLQAAGLPCVVLKGPSVAAWLYAEGERGYVDSDVLVPRWHAEAAAGVLRGLGFEAAQDAEGRRSEVSRPWRRRADDRSVDLHVSVHGATEAPERVWDLLAERVRPLDLGPAQVPVLDVPARALLVALHAQQHADRPGGKPFEDLRRALAQTDDATWDAAATLALALGAERSFVEGLRLLPAGEAVLARMALGRAMSGRAAPLRVALLRVRSARGGRQARAAVRLLVPAPTTMRWRSPVARRGRGGLAAAYGLRLAGAARSVARRRERP
ncbi:nucleotidyltransferase family protein [Conexibacter sp. SYSU D00693]|uniref:nucleotidyltransferase family protein n=1 Tax=Conexibacter sp. SYSU D00693 TaxID=2812560 RepID=UPI00196A3715|nr:nucleotidyltransferase family protein [Conexibacter sp. SYSU D00693]